MLGNSVQEIVVANKQTALNLMATLVEEKYATMLTREEDLWVINFTYAATEDCDQASRNHVVFGDEYDFEQAFTDRAEKCTDEAARRVRVEDFDEGSYDYEDEVHRVAKSLFNKKFDSPQDL